MRESEWQPLHHESLDFWQNFMTSAFEEEFQRHRLHVLFQRICFCGGFWCHTVILSLSTGRTALFLRNNTLNSQRFLLQHLLFGSNSIAEIRALSRRGEMVSGFLPVLRSSRASLGFKPATSQSKAYSLILLASTTVLVFQEGEPGVKESEENIVQKQHSVIPFTLRGHKLQNHLIISCTWIIRIYYITAVRW